MIREALASDAAAIEDLDHIAALSPARREFIRRVIASGSCNVKIVDAAIIAYGVLDYRFFENGFISLLYVSAAFRRQGVGTELMLHLQAACITSKLFTSTNSSNIPMQRLLHKLGYKSSGMIENLDSGDPEQIFFKQLRP